MGWRPFRPERSGGGPAGGTVPALLSALLLGLAQPPFQVPGLPFLALVPLATALGRGPLGGAGVGETGGGWAGGVFALVFWTLQLVWIPTLVGPTFPWAFPGYGLVVGLLAGLGALLGVGVRRMSRRGGVPLPLAFALGWVGVEWIRGNLPFGLAWPWLGLALTLTDRPLFLGWAGWVGEAGLSFWLALVNGCVASGVLRWGEGGGRGREGWSRIAVPWLAAGGLLLFPLGLGAGRGGGDVSDPGVTSGPRVAVVGTAVGREGRRRSPEGEALEALEQVGEALKGLPPGGVDLVVLPEGTIPVPLNLPAGVPFRARLEGLAREVGAPILMGTVLVDSPDGDLEGFGEPRRGRELRTNSAVLIEAATPVGAGGQESPRPEDPVALAAGFPYRYDKVRLVPGMEWGGYRRGTGPAILSVKGWRFGVLICYESLFPDLAAALRRGGAQYLVNLTSDRWLGEPHRIWGRWFLEQHPAHLVLRASENRTPAVRAANVGVSMVVDGWGRRLAGRGPGPGLLVMELPPPLPPPPGGGWTGRVGPVALFLGLVLLLAPKSPRRGKGKGMGGAGRAA